MSPLRVLNLYVETASREYRRRFVSNIIRFVQLPVVSENRAEAHGAFMLKKCLFFSSVQMRGELEWNALLSSARMLQESSAVEVSSLYTLLVGSIIDLINNNYPAPVWVDRSGQFEETELTCGLNRAYVMLLLET